jgi:DNA-binding NarL/FixJ family response regulator
MNANARLHPTVRCDAPLPLARTLACPPPRDQEEEQVARTNELITQLVDALVHAFPLSEWEEQVVHHVLFGRNCGAIGWRLGIRETTVHKHMHRLYAKTGCDSRRELYDLALRLTVRDELLASTRRAAA